MGRNWPETSPRHPPPPQRPGSPPGTKRRPSAQRRSGSAPGGLARSWPLARARHACSGTQTGPPILGDSIPPNSGDLPRLQIAEPSQVRRQTEPSPNQEGPRRSLGRQRRCLREPDRGRKMALAGCSWLLLSGEREPPSAPGPSAPTASGRERDGVSRSPAGWVGRQLGSTQAQAQCAHPRGTRVGRAAPWGRQGGPQRSPRPPVPESGRGGPCCSLAHVANPD